MELLLARIQERLVRETEEVHRRTWTGAGVAMALGVVLLVIGIFQHSSGIVTNGGGDGRHSRESQQSDCCCCSTGEREVSQPNLPTTPSVVSSLVFVTGLAIVAGCLLIILGKNSTARAVGTITLASGLIGHLIHEVKIDSIFKVDTLKVEANIEAQLNKLKPIGPEHLGYVDGFGLGDADLTTAMHSKLEAICTEWKARKGEGKEGLLLLVGATDLVRLNTNARKRYESNFGLARARAEAVRGSIAECGVPNPEMLALVSGPKNTPYGLSQMERREGFPEDRRVDIWAVWGLPKASSNSLRVGVSIGGDQKKSE
jgi:hypothetical protein